PVPRPWCPSPRWTAMGRAGSPSISTGAAWPGPLTPRSGRWRSSSTGSWAAWWGRWHEPAGTPDSARWPDGGCDRLPGRRPAVAGQGPRWVRGLLLLLPGQLPRRCLPGRGAGHLGWGPDLPGAGSPAEADGAGGHRDDPDPRL